MRSNPKISSFKDPLFFEGLLKYHDASYLRWNRLTDKQQKQFKEYNLLPDQLNLALKVLHRLKTEYKTESVPFAINIVSLIYDKYNEWLTTQDIERKHLSEDRAHKELLFRGFVLLDKFHVKPKRSYVMTAFPVKGKFYIHPFEMGSNYRMTNGKRELPHLWDNFIKIGLSGYTRVIYPEMEYFPNLSSKQSNQLKIDWDIA